MDFTNYDRVPVSIVILSITRLVSHCISSSSSSFFFSKNQNQLQQTVRDPNRRSSSGYLRAPTIANNQVRASMDYDRVSDNLNCQFFFFGLH